MSDFAGARFDGFAFHQGHAGKIAGLRGARHLRAGPHRDAELAAFATPLADAPGLIQADLNAAGLTITGTNGADTINGTEDDDTISALGGNDVVNGNGGNDRIDAGAGNDIVNGGNGDDNLIGGTGSDGCFGDSGTDTADSSCEAKVDIP